MTPAQRANFQRLLKPRHVAVIGGRDAVVAITECERSGYQGIIWPVNPKRDTIKGYPCFDAVQDLPEAPDAVFLAVPASAAVGIIGDLAAMGAGGIVCYTAGFAEAGQADAQQALIEAAGDMALIGPNCYGMINYLDHVALWPFTHGGGCPGFGAAILTQSGMLSSDLTMSQRSMPFTHMISAGNQAVLQLEDFVDVLCEREEVRAIGMHIEGLHDVQKFIDAVQKALVHNTPLVVLKTGTSQVGAQLTVSHTGSLSGANELYQALFDRLGVISVENPSQLLETLKFICLSGIPTGNKVMGFTCSGGGATMLADYGEKIGLTFAQPEPDTAATLREQLPDIATVSNPLDYTTPIWGQQEPVEAVITTACRDAHHAAITVQDYPLPGLDETKPYYFNDTKAFVNATKAANLPAAVCCTLPENLDKETRDYLVSVGVTPAQGIHEALDAIAAAAWYGKRRAEILEGDAPSQPLNLVRRDGATASGSTEEIAEGIQRQGVYIDEYQGKQRLKAAGIAIPNGQLVTADKAADLAGEIGFPVVLKMVSAKLAHKTEAGAVKLNLQSAQQVSEAIQAMQQSVAAYDPEAISDQFLLEPMVPNAVTELMVSIRYDDQFGLAMTLASGGILVELIADAVTLLLPTSEQEILTALDKLKVSTLLDGFRGQPAANKNTLAAELLKLTEFMSRHANEIAEVEINPLFVLEDGICAIDVLMQEIL